MSAPARRLSGDNTAWLAGIAVVLVAAWFVGSALLPGHLPAGVAVQGVVVGSLDALVALGLVLVYRAQRIVNFAQAQMGAIGAAAAVIGVAGLHLSYYISILLGIVAAALTGLFADRIISWRFSRAPRLVLMVVTIGLEQLFGAVGAVMPEPFHLSPTTSFGAPFRVSWNIGPILFNQNDVVAIVVVPVVLVALWWFLDRTDTGIAIRAASDSTERSALLGIPVRRLNRITWLLAAIVAGIGAMLAVPIAPVAPSLGSVPSPELLLIPLAAAVVGGMESLPVTFVAAIVLGVFQQASYWSYPNPSFVSLVIFALILVALLVQPYSPVAKSRRSRDHDDSLGGFVGLREVRAIPSALAKLPVVRYGRTALLAVLAIAALVVPLAFSGEQVLLLSYVSIYALIAVSLVLLSGWSGHMSLGQFAFVGVGAALTGSLMVHAHMDMFLALVISGAAGAVVAAGIGWPALRMSGLFLAVVTLAFAIPVSSWLLSASNFPLLNPGNVPRPVLFGRISLTSPWAFYELCTVIVIIAMLLAHNLRRSRPGRAMVAVRDSERGAAAFSVSPLRTRLLAFSISGAIAGVAGGLYVLALGGLGNAGIPVEKSLFVFAMAVLGGIGSLTGAVLGAVYLELVSHYLSSALQLLATGVGILIILAIIPEGLADIWFRLRDLVLSAIAKHEEAGGDLPLALAGDGGPAENTTQLAAIRLGALEALEDSDGPPPAPEADVSYPSAPDPITASLTNGASGDEASTLRAISCSDIDASYGSRPVLHDVALDVMPGEVLALLGTNGAGKSTILRVLSGLLAAETGRVILGGEDITGLDTVARARRGLVMVPGGHGVFRSLSVAENLRLAMWMSRHGRHRSAPSMERTFELFPVLADRLSTRAGLLSGGEQQMLALAQAFLCSPKVLMIDELSLGLAPTVVAEVLGAVRRLVEEGTTVVVVEQSVNVATAIADRAVFLERGRVRFFGPTPDLTAQHDLLRSVFLRAAARAVTSHDAPAQVSSGVVDVLAGLAAPTPDATAGQQGQGDSRARPDSVLVSSDAGPAMTVTGISKSYGGISALSDVSFQVQPGEILGIIGANGAGKTTLFDTCSGFIVPDQGRILFDGVDITTEPPYLRARRGLGRVFQDGRVFPSLSVEEAIAVAFERFVEVRDPLLCSLDTLDASLSEAAIRVGVEGLLAEFGLARWRDNFVSELSVGTRRMVELACILAHRPKLLLLDEPSSGIAQRESEALGDLLKGLRDRTGAAFVIIEHDVPLVSSIADRLICLHLGSVIAEGSTTEVLHDPAVVDAYLGTDQTAIARSGLA